MSDKPKLVRDFQLFATYVDEEGKSYLVGFFEDNCVYCMIELSKETSTPEHMLGYKNVCAIRDDTPPMWSIYLKVRHGNTSVFDFYYSDGEGGVIKKTIDCSSLF